MNKQFTPFDIIWIKNVSNTDEGTAYMDLINTEFVLHFPNHHKGNILKPNIGEIILIHQNINGKKVFTHLVTPTDKILREENRENYKFGRMVRVIAKTSINNVIPVSTTLWDEVSFGGISMGNACEIANISHVNNYDNLLQDIWTKFIPYFETTFQPSISLTELLNDEINSIDPDLTVTEGKLRLITHFIRERDKNIIREKKKKAVLIEQLKCEVCNFSFIDRFGVEFIECHHKTPISQSGVTETTLSDLALVCSNCHRMLHKQFNGQFLSIDELRQKINVIL